MPPHYTRWPSASGRSHGPCPNVMCWSSVPARSACSVHCCCAATARAACWSPKRTRPDASQLARHAGAETFDPLTDTPAIDSAFDLVIDAVGAAPTRQLMLQAVAPGSVAVHIGLQDWSTEIDMRKLTLAEITLIGTYTYSTADLHATVDALHRGQFGDLTWVQERPLSEGAAAFDDLHNRRSAAAKIVLCPTTA
ncbi:MAG: hypothetical protein R3E68_08330 [Burkholderiaceae bacterium]